MSAAEAPRMASTPGEQSGSAESTVATTWTSSLYRQETAAIGRSIIRPLKTAASLGLPSRLKKPPGIFPAA